MVDFIAKRSVGELKLYADGFYFGSLKDCEVTWLFEASSIEVEETVNHEMEGDMSISERLAVIRKVYTNYLIDCAAEAKAEEISERSFYNKLENGNPEAAYEMEWQDAMGYT